MTEFGICDPNGDAESVDTIECEFVMRQADEYLQSWTYWDSLFFNDSLHGQSVVNRDVTKVKNICIRRMRIITLLFVEYRMRIANTRYQY